MRALSKIDYGKSGSMHFVQIEVAWEKKAFYGQKQHTGFACCKKHPKGKSGFLSDAMLFKGNVRKKLPASLTVGEHHGISQAVGLPTG